jgi:hypothetical protein
MRKISELWKLSLLLILLTTGCQLKKESVSKRNPTVVNVTVEAADTVFSNGKFIQ